MLTKIRGYLAYLKVKKAVKKNKIPKNLRELQKRMKRAGIWM